MSFLSQDPAPASKQIETRQPASASPCASPEVKGKMNHGKNYQVSNNHCVENSFAFEIILIRDF